MIFCRNRLLRKLFLLDNVWSHKAIRKIETRLINTNGFVTKYYEKCILLSVLRMSVSHCCSWIVFVSVNTTPKKFENCVFTLKTNPLFSIHTMLEKFATDTTITSLLRRPSLGSSRYLPPSRGRKIA